MTSRPADLYPSLLSADLSQLQQQLDLAEPLVQGWHVDIMDGHFVPNLTFGPPLMASLQTDLPLDVHLMVTNPQDLILPCHEAGASSIAVHVEVAPHLHRLLSLIRSLDMQAGVALNPATPLSAIEEAIPHIDYILLMTVNPGFSGQQLIDSTLSKLSALRSQLSHVDIRVDGGVTLQNASLVRDAGASSLVSGSAFWGSDDLATATAHLRGISLTHS